MSLRSLSDQQILSDIQALTRRERSITLQVLLHLNEIERRRLHLKLGHSSMFDYCTSGLGYSASAASRRIRTARCVARFPEVYELLESNQVNVSTVAQVSHILTSENKREVLTRIRGKSQREVEAVIADYEPLASIPRDRVRTVVVRVPVAMTPLVSASLCAATVVVPVANSEAETRQLPNSVPACAPAVGHDRNGCAPDTQGDRPASHTNLERRALVQFSASAGFMAKVEHVRSIAWHRLPVNATLEQVFELALDLVLEREDPFKRCERRAGNAKLKRAPEPHPVRTSQSQNANPRHVSLATKDDIYVRDKGRCTFVGTNGRRCASTRAVQMDHIKPVAFGGAGTPDNLRLLCAYHNRFEADRLLASPGRSNRLHADERPPTGR